MKYAHVIMSSDKQKNVEIFDDKIRKYLVYQLDEVYIYINYFT
ncbi:hypothetical protein DJ66_0972 [Candidatus Liberibacter solanacearum]|uniref:Uncharacterized protein n=1 Tax=Candidatus Liberibacter solanacearum TaxID=556287 RepID=A0A0F4VL54_9HYPH|nr:hypothetical protein DJ66_0972 [Candidatus Liberibacter solanacearum]